MVSIVVPCAKSEIDKIVNLMSRAPAQVRYTDLFKLCVAMFGDPRQSGSSHAVFKTPWLGDPRVNIQNANGKAKPYQVRQVLKAVERMKGSKETGEDA